MLSLFSWKMSSCYSREERGEYTLLKLRRLCFHFKIILQTSTLNLKYLMLGKPDPPNQLSRAREGSQKQSWSLYVFELGSLFICMVVQLSVLVGFPKEWGYLCFSWLGDLFLPIMFPCPALIWDFVPSLIVSCYAVFGRYPWEACSGEWGGWLGALKRGEIAVRKYWKQKIIK